MQISDLAPAPSFERKWNLALSAAILRSCVDSREPQEAIPLRLEEHKGLSTGRSGDHHMLFVLGQVVGASEPPRALEPTKMCLVGRMVGSSMSSPWRCG